MMTLIPNRYVVSLPLFRRPDGAHVATHHMCVPTEERAQEIVSGHPSRSYRLMTEAEQEADARHRSQALLAATV